MSTEVYILGEMWVGLAVGGALWLAGCGLGESRVRRWEQTKKSDVVVREVVVILAGLFGKSKLLLFFEYFLIG